jgi:hypothetical protein
MRITTIAALLMLCPLLAAAEPAEKLAEAHQQVTAGQLYAADALCQEIVSDEDAVVAEIEEALFLQCMIYSGDVLGAVALMQPMAVATTEGSELKAEISRQLVLARRAFSVAMNSYLNATVLGSELDSVSLQLPPLSGADVEVMLGTLHDAEALNEINSSYETDPTPGRGLLAQANRYSFILALSDALPAVGTRDVEAISRQLAAGQRFSDLHFLDWGARVALDMHVLLQEPEGPDLLGLARRCDERLLHVAGADEGNQYVKNARERAARY